MRAPIAYGIDYGTTNSSISVAYEDHIEMLIIDQNESLPACLSSITYLDRYRVQQAGRNALDLFTIAGNQRTTCSSCDLVRRTRFGTESNCKQFRPGGGCLDSRLMSELKTVLTSDIESTHSWAEDYELADLACIVIKELKKLADTHTGHDIRKAVIGHPVAFVGAEGEEAEERNELAMNRLREAVKRAGFKEVTLYPEPAAVVLGEVLEDGITITVDFGGGTFDTAVVHTIDGEGEVLSLQGAAVGGAMFDALIFDNKLTSLLGLDSLIGSNRNLRVPAWFKQRLRSLGGFKHLLSNALTPVVMSDIKGVNNSAGKLLEEIIHGGQAGPFYSAIETAKISLTSQPNTHIDFHSPDSNITIPLQREEFDKWIAPYLKVVRETIEKAMEEANIDANDVKNVIRTGGSSNLGAFIDMLNRMYGPEKVLSRNAFTSVAYGLGVYAQEENRYG